MAKYFLTNKAVEDLSEIWAYTYEVWSENQADFYYELMIQTCGELANHPEKGRIYEAIQKDVLGFRIEKHIIFFRRIHTNEIEILRILHERMDLKNRLGG